MSHKHMNCDYVNDDVCDVKWAAETETFWCWRELPLVLMSTWTTGCRLHCIASLIICISIQYSPVYFYHFSVRSWSDFVLMETPVFPHKQRKKKFSQDSMLPGEAFRWLWKHQGAKQWSQRSSDWCLFLWKQSEVHHSTGRHYWQQHIKSSITDSEPQLAG